MTNPLKAVQLRCRSRSWQKNKADDDRKVCAVNYMVCSMSTLLFFSIMFILILIPSKNIPLFSRRIPRCQDESSTFFNRTVHRDQLEKALAGASTGDKTVIITMVNEAYVEGYKPMLDLFLDAFWLGDDTRSLANHLLVVAVDQTSYERCRFLRLHCYKLETDGVDFLGEKRFMSEDFIKLMWRRTLFLGDVLRRGYNFIFTDTDVLWLRNPFPSLRLNGTIDLQISTDDFNGDQWSETNHINTGFYMIKSNHKTIALFDSWYAAKNSSIGWKDQDVLIKLMNDGFFRELGLKVRFLDTLHFSGFCQNSKDARQVITVHANCCQSVSAKLSDLTATIYDWKRFKNSTSNETTTFRWSDHVNCWNSWKS